MLTNIKDYVFPAGNVARPNIPLHPATPLITAAEELNPLTRGAAPDYKATAIALAKTVLLQNRTNEVLAKGHSDQLKNVMVLAGAIQTLRPVVRYVRDNPILWAFVPKSLKGSIDLVLSMILPGDERSAGSDAFNFSAAASVSSTQTAGSTRIGRDA